MPAYLDIAVAQHQFVAGTGAVVIGPREALGFRGAKLDAFRRKEHLSSQGLHGFWRYAAERFLVLEQAMRIYGMDRCLHLESDNLLLVNPAPLGRYLARTFGREVGVCPLTEREDTAAAMYVGSLGALARMTDALVEMASMRPASFLSQHGGPMANEMRMLRVARDAGLVRALPIAPADSGLPDHYIFDPASYGQWLDGTPQRPGERFAADIHILGPRLMSGDLDLEWCAQGRQTRVKDSVAGVSASLVNIHLHSKRLTEWSIAAAQVVPLGLPRPRYRHLWRRRRDFSVVNIPARVIDRLDRQRNRH